MKPDLPELTSDVFQDFLYDQPKNTGVFFDIDGTLISIEEHWRGNVIASHLEKALKKINKLTNNGLGFITARQEDNLRHFIGGLDHTQISLVAACGRMIFIDDKQAEDVNRRLSPTLLQEASDLHRDYKTRYPEPIFDLQFSLDKKGLHAVELLTKAPDDLKMLFLTDVARLFDRHKSSEDIITSGHSGHQLLRPSLYKDKSDALRYVQQKKNHHTLFYAGDTATDITSIRHAADTSGIGVVVGHKGEYNPKCCAAATHYVKSPDRLVKIICQSVGVHYNLNDVQKFPLARPQPTPGYSFTLT